MNIAILRRTYITELDGVNKFIFSLCDGLRSIGHHVKVVTWGFYGVNKVEDLNQWAQKMYDVDTDILSLRDKPSRGNPWSKIAWDWFRKGSKLVNGLGLDAVIINGIVPLRFQGERVAVNHGLYMQSNRVDFIRKYVTRNLYKNCIRVCVSEGLADEYKKFFGLSCHTIPLPLRISSSNPRGFEERDDSVLHIGTRPVKNLETSINACKELMKNKIHVKLIVAGAWKDYAERLVENARNSGIDVETKYDFEARELGHLYSRAKALILPSKYEALPYVTLESMTNGTPVVVSQAIPSEVVVENFNGFRIDTSDPADYARAIAMLMKDPILWTWLSQNASRSVRRYDHVGVAKQYVELIEKSRAERIKRHGLEPRLETVPNN